MDILNVEPKYREEAMQRIAAIKEFLCGERDPIELERTATRLELSTSQARRLIRSWEMHENPTLITSGGRSGPRKPSSRRFALIRDTAARALTEYGTHAPTKQIVKTVATECQKAGYDEPTSQQIHTIVMKARRANRKPADGAEKSTLVARIWLQLPVVYLAGMPPKRPEGVITLHLPSKKLELVTDLDLDKSEPSSQFIELVVSDTDWSGSDSLQDDSSGSVALLSRYLGDGFGNINILFRKPRSPAANLTYLDATSLSPDEARKIVDEAIIDHHREISAALESSHSGLA